MAYDKNPTRLHQDPNFIERYAAGLDQNEPLWFLDDMKSAAPDLRELAYDRRLKRNKEVLKTLQEANLRLRDELTMLTESQRVVLVKPDDILVFGNVGDMDLENVSQVINSLKEKLGLRVMFFAADIDIDVLTKEELAQIVAERAKGESNGD